MYRIYTSDAFILNTRIQGEANLTVNAFTKEFGFVRAMAQGAMFLKSKNRYALQKLALSVISFVRGKEIWRITTAQPVAAPRGLSRDARLALARVFAIVERLVYGEEKDENLFSILADFYDFLSGLKPADRLVCRRAELVVLLRILYHMGYIDPIGEYSSIVSTYALSIEQLDSMSGKEQAIEQRIQQALTASQL